MAGEARFVTGGFHATSVDEVAERAGYSKGAVYSNFAAKEDLFFAVYERRVEQALTRWSGPAPSRRGPRSTSWPPAHSAARPRRRLAGGVL